MLETVPQTLVFVMWDKIKLDKFTCSICIFHYKVKRLSHVILHCEVNDVSDKIYSNYKYMSSISTVNINS